MHMCVVDIEDKEDEGELVVDSNQHDITMYENNMRGCKCSSGIWV